MAVMISRRRASPARVRTSADSAVDSGKLRFRLKNCRVGVENLIVNQPLGPILAVPFDSGNRAPFLAVGSGLAAELSHMLGLAEFGISESHLIDIIARDCYKTIIITTTRSTRPPWFKRGGQEPEDWLWQLYKQAQARGAQPARLEPLSVMAWRLGILRPL